MSDFYRAVSLRLATSLVESHPDNFDRLVKPFGLYRHAIVLLERMIATLGRILGRDLTATILSRHNFYLQNLQRFEATYDLLADVASREKFVELLVYRMLGFTKVRLSLAERDMKSLRAQVASWRTDTFLPVDRKYGFDHLYLYDLNSAGLDLKLFLGSNGVLNDFLLQQYRYSDQVRVRTGDIVVDAGACWGDTALYFAAMGAERVYAYEFIPSNLALFEQNLKQNPAWSDKIVPVERAVWAESGQPLSFDDRGQASRVAQAGVYLGSTRTLSIDDLVLEQGLPRIDFIKMDIEGAELPALRGAAETIRRFKPRLAIAVYHEPQDMIEIPAFLQSLNPAYCFFLDYFTTVWDEIILYAIDTHER